MSEQEKASREILLDVREARLRSYAGTTVQTILKAWLRRKNLWYFFRSDLEMALVYVDRKLYIEIRRRNVRENPESLIRNK